MPKFTHFDYLEITKQEQALKLFFSVEKMNKLNIPKKETIDNILNYSKSLSIRKSEHINFIELILN